MTYIRLKRLNESTISDLIAQDIAAIINNIDDSLSYNDFADAVATVIRDNYGSHNIEPFLTALIENLENYEEQ